MVTISATSSDWPRISRLNRLTASLQDEAAACFAATGHKVRWFTDIHYGARSWDRARRVIAKIEYSSHGANPRYVVTNLEGDAKHLYGKLYCARGDMENRIKENQLDMFGDRTSCQRWWGISSTYYAPRSPTPLSRRSAASPSREPNWPAPMSVPSV